MCSNQGTVGIALTRLKSNMTIVTVTIIEFDTRVGTRAGLRVTLLGCVC